MPAAAAPFAVIVIAFLLIAMALTVKVWADAMTRGIEGSRRGGITGIITLPFRIVSSVVTPAVNYVGHEISKHASHYMHPLARWLDGLTLWWFSSYLAVGLMAEAAAVGFERLTHVVLPREVGRATKPINKKATAALGLAGLTAAALKRYARGIDRLLRDQVIPQLRHATHAVDVALPHSIAGVRSRVGVLERDLANPSKAWLRRLANALWLTALTGLLVKWLAKKFPWLFCKKVGKVGNRACGMNLNLLQWMLDGTLLAMSPFTLQAFARDAVEVLDLFVEGLDWLLTDIQLADADYLGATSGALPGVFADYLD